MSVLTDVVQVIPDKVLAGDGAALQIILYVSKCSVSLHLFSVLQLVDLLAGLINFLFYVTDGIFEFTDTAAKAFSEFRDFFRAEEDQNHEADQNPFAHSRHAY